VPDAVPVDMVVSPDGGFVYVLMARRDVGAVAVYARDQATGALTLANCVAENGGATPCGAVHGLAGARSIAVSPDGRSVYVAGHYYEDGGDLTTFSRDATSGALTQLGGADGCLSPVPYADCGQGPGFVRPSSVAVAHDGATVYVVYANDTEGTGPGSVLAEYTRDSGSGALTYESCIAPHRPGCVRARGVSGFTRVTISVDGRYMYLAGSAGLGIFRP
jgi:DNA-binding beta-propeller fold protein YncE